MVFRFIRARPGGRCVRQGSLGSSGVVGFDPACPGGRWVPPHGPMGSNAYALFFLGVHPVSLGSLSHTLVVVGFILAR